MLIYKIRNPGPESRIRNPGLKKSDSGPDSGFANFTGPDPGRDPDKNPEKIRPGKIRPGSKIRSGSRPRTGLYRKPRKPKTGVPG